MKHNSALRVLAEVTESQWGMVTSAQAVARGINHVTLARLAEAGDLVRLVHGVYRDAGAPGDEHQELRAAWLGVEPARLAWERLQESPSFATVSGESAAVLHGIGSFRAMYSEFTTPTRKQTQRNDVRYRTRALPFGDVVVEAGLPVTTVERTIADLIEARIELDHIGDALREVMRRTAFDLGRLEERLVPLAERNGHRKGDGAALLQQVLETAGVDEESLATQIASTPSFGALIAQKYLASLPQLDASNAATALAAIQPTVAEQISRIDWVSLSSLVSAGRSEPSE